MGRALIVVNELKYLSLLPRSTFIFSRPTRSRKHISDHYPLVSSMLAQRRSRSLWDILSTNNVFMSEAFRILPCVYTSWNHHRHGGVTLLRWSFAGYSVLLNHNPQSAQPKIASADCPREYLHLDRRQRNHPCQLCPRWRRFWSLRKWKRTPGTGKTQAILLPSISLRTYIHSSRRQLCKFAFCGRYCILLLGVDGMRLSFRTFSSAYGTIVAFCKARGCFKGRNISRAFGCVTIEEGQPVLENESPSKSRQHKNLFVV